METINDIGAAEFLGINTLTLSIYSTWINQSDLASAAQIAIFHADVHYLLSFNRRFRTSNSVI